MSRSPQPSGARPKVLVVDDSEVAQVAVRRALEAAGYRVVCTDNPLLVPYMMATESPQVVLVDYEMPAVRGDMVTEIIRSGSKPGDGVGVYLYSSRSEGELAEAAKSCGADGFVCKDAGMDALRAVVDRWVGVVERSGALSRSGTG